MNYVRYGTFEYRFMKNSSTTYIACARELKFLPLNCDRINSTNDVFAKSMPLVCHLFIRCFIRPNDLAKEADNPIKPPTTRLTFNLQCPVQFTALSLSFHFRDATPRLYFSFPSPPFFFILFYLHSHFHDCYVSCEYHNSKW